MIIVIISPLSTVSIWENDSAHWGFGLFELAPQCKNDSDNNNNTNNNNDNIIKKTS